MINARWGRVIRVVARRPGGLTEVLAEAGGAERPAVALERLTGGVKAGDRVLLNTTAVDLGLGSGGYDFVMAVDTPDAVDDSRVEPVADGSGHIMKLRYTPLQFRVLSAEEEASPLRQAVEASTGLEGTPVVVGSLHSCLTPVVLGIVETAPRPVRLMYVMTDGGTLPIAWSRTVSDLKDRGLLSVTVTAGQAFGGDLEAVNKHSGLLVAKAAGAEVIVVALGPGIVGTGTLYGHTGLEQGEIVDAVNLLGGRAVAVPRLSFADRRERHRGLSHHFLTALGEVCHTQATIALPEMPLELRSFVEAQLARCPGLERHQVQVERAGLLAEAARRHGLTLSSMGRGYEQDPFCFEAGWAAGVIAARMVHGEG